MLNDILHVIFIRNIKVLGLGRNLSSYQLNALNILIFMHQGEYEYCPDTVQSNQNLNNRPSLEGILSMFSDDDIIKVPQWETHGTNSSHSPTCTHENSFRSNHFSDRNQKT